MDHHLGVIWTVDHITQLIEFFCSYTCLEKIILFLKYFKKL